MTKKPSIYPERDKTMLVLLTSLAMAIELVA